MWRESFLSSLFKNLIQIWTLKLYMHVTTVEEGIKDRIPIFFSQNITMQQLNQWCCSCGLGNPTSKVIMIIICIYDMYFFQIHLACLKLKYEFWGGVCFPQQLNNILTTRFSYEVSTLKDGVLYTQPLLLSSP